MIFELKPVADDFLNPKMQRDGTNCEIERPRDEHVTVPKLGSCMDKRLSLRKNRGLQRHLEKIVRQTNEPVAVHSAISAK